VLQRFSLSLIEPIPRRNRGKSLENRRLKRAYRFYGNPPCGLGTKDKDCSCSRASSLMYYLRSLGDRAVRKGCRPKRAFSSLVGCFAESAQQARLPPEYAVVVIPKIVQLRRIGTPSEEVLGIPFPRWQRRRHGSPGGAPAPMYPVVQNESQFGPEPLIPAGPSQSSALCSIKTQG
jgi:hypothetical protein